ncbi:hypothetical protein AYI68_g6972 [Smittium mucronatum]|uniref:Uncharacterized protein n=1 Tax=Smittium mucronatum TaxID=133383 RepID=A0A1R0GQ01_9FUNG|nr:hypothetical protein AYI68_g6972 [Smittium mucronatum]
METKSGSNSPKNKEINSRKTSPLKRKAADNSIWEHKQVVFVDPLEKDAAYWWAAMIVPKNEIDISMNCGDVGADECVVRSVVPYSDLAIFDMSSEPFKTFKENGGDEFASDKGIQAAIEYLFKGSLPTDFMWASWETQKPLESKKAATTPGKSLQCLHMLAMC